MKITNELLRQLYNHFNDYVFGGELPGNIEIYVYSSKINKGFIECYPDDYGLPICCIRISDKYNKNYLQLCETVLHEMVHYYQYIKMLPVEHNKTFNKMAKVIKKELGINIK